MNRLRLSLWFLLALLLAACGDTPSSADLSQSRLQTQSTTPATEAKPLPELIVYIHGYNAKGVDKHQVYGALRSESLTDAIARFGSFTPLQSLDQHDFRYGVAMTTYYGDTPPAYYSDADIAQIDAVTQRYGGGIPRYALIVAKFIRHTLTATGAAHVMLISGSMGSLVTRWMIEKNLENLAAEGRIAKWLSINGVIRGNYLSSQSDLAKFVNAVQPQPIDVKHMSYRWIETNLHDPKSVADAPFYKRIQIGEISSTRSGKPFGALLKDKPNDGYQVVRDTYFKEVSPQARYHDLPPTHSYFHRGHIGIKEARGAWLAIYNFLTSKKRVRITLEAVTVDNLHEKRMPLQHKTRSEIVFASSVVSPEALKSFGISDPVCRRTLTGGTLPVHHYTKAGETRLLSQTIYDDFVLPSERSLDITLEGYELDDAIKYGIHELLLGGNERLGSVTMTLPLQNGTYPFEAEEYRGTIKVEIIDYL